jgi:hypothetical protein
MEILKNIFFENESDELDVVSRLNSDIRNNISSQTFNFFENNLPDNQPKVVVKNNLLFYYCPFCNEIHSTKIANYPGLPEINYSELRFDTWLWNENKIKPTFDHCFHTLNNEWIKCDVFIRNGLIFRPTTNSTINHYLKNTTNFNDKLKNYAKLYANDQNAHVATYDLLSKEYAKKRGYWDTFINKIPETIPHMFPMLPVNKWPIKIN